MPLLLEAVKETLNHRQGMQMKIIKFHLFTHFADDILQWGTMINYDSAMGELHHKSAAKKLAQRMQWRKEVFKEQTAQRQVENLSIEMTHASLQPPTIQEESSEDQNKCQNIKYHHNDRKLYKLEQNKK